MQRSEAKAARKTQLRFPGRSILLMVPALIILALFLVSVVRMIGLSFFDNNGFTLDHYIQFFSRPDYIEIYIRTVLISFAVTFFCILIGYPMAFAIWKYKGNRNYLMIAVILPWLVSLVVRTYGWIVILGPRGLINEFLKWVGVIDSPVKMMFNSTGVIIGLTHVLVPFMIISILSVMLHLNQKLEEASMSLGAKPFHTFRRITLPLTMPGIISGSMLVYLMSTGAIVTPILLGGVQDRMVGTQMYQEVIQTFNFPKASMLAFLLLIVGLAVIIPLQKLEKRFSAGGTAGGN